MPIIRLTKKQIEEANKARGAALLKDPEFRAHEERHRLSLQAAMERCKVCDESKTESRSAAVRKEHTEKKEAAPARNQEQPL